MKVFVWNDDDAINLVHIYPHMFLQLSTRLFTYTGEPKYLEVQDVGQANGE